MTSPVELHQMLHMAELGGIFITLAVALRALARPKFTIKAIVKELNELQLKSGN